MDLQERIKQRIWHCNELNEKQAEDYAWIAMNEMQKWLVECRAQMPGDANLSSPMAMSPLPNSAWNTFKAFNAGREARALQSESNVSQA